MPTYLGWLKRRTRGGREKREPEEKRREAEGEERQELRKVMLEGGEGGGTREEGTRDREGRKDAKVKAKRKRERERVDRYEGEDN